jgi:hypothetical protein
MASPSMTRHYFWVLWFVYLWTILGGRGLWKYWDYPRQVWFPLASKFVWSHNKLSNWSYWGNSVCNLWSIRRMHTQVKFVKSRKKDSLTMQRKFIQPHQINRYLNSPLVLVSHQWKLSNHAKSIDFSISPFGISFSSIN